MTPVSPLAAATGYTVTVNYNGTVYDAVGYAVAGYASYNFTSH
ncbi:MAG: Ig-like domain-containing protein [Terriglobales bacterium]